MTTPPDEIETADAVLVGGGIASATLAAMLTELQPQWRVVVLERLAAPGQESSDAWNNAGTGHSALCELNYTPQGADGSVDTAKALRVNSQFQASREFWSFLLERGALGEASEFINPVAHMSFVSGAADVDFLRRRHAALAAHPLFSSLAFSDDPGRISEWAPLVMSGRAADSPVAATRSTEGSDVDFGALTRKLLAHAGNAGATAFRTGCEVRGLRRIGKRHWGVMYRQEGRSHLVRAPFVFVGAGGRALPLLQKAGIAEIRGYGGFPISGQWLRCTNPEVVARHEAKVYGKAAVGAPPMSVPHLDTRYIDGKKGLLFGPYAGWSPKFLRHGSPLDLPLSLRPGNLLPMMQVGIDNLDLTAYLVREVAATRKARLAALREYFPEARDEDWESVTAGQRVQVIAPHPKKRGVLQFGTELITSADGSLGGLLGASPGASTAVTVACDLLQRCFPEKWGGWEPTLLKMVPSLGKDLTKDADAARQSLVRTAKILGLL
ncbi:malate:quinone oxidoreductase [Dermabacteraceae bacterium P7006]